MHHAGMKYSLPSRELIADSIEIMATAHPVDGLILVANCDKIIPGMLMAALRLNIPAILISGGPMLAGRFKGQAVDLITVFEGVGAVKGGKIGEDELKELSECACPGCGSCAGMFTANSMNCLSEALGLALPGNGTIPAVHAARYRLAKEAGFKIMELVTKQILPRQIATLAAFKNAMAVDMALGCSTNTVLHVPAIAREAGIELSLDLFNEISVKTPHLCAMSPGGAHHLEDLDAAGGVPAVMAVLMEAGLVDGAPLTATGATVADNLAPVRVLDAERHPSPGQPLPRPGWHCHSQGQPGPGRRGGQTIGGGPPDAGERRRAPGSLRPKKRPPGPSWRAASSPATSWSSATKAPRAAPACGRCSPPPRPSPAWAWTRKWRC